MTFDQCRVTPLGCGQNLCKRLSVPVNGLRGFGPGKFDGNIPERQTRVIPIYLLQNYVTGCKYTKLI